MFQLKTKDFELLFEYDTEEELKTALENAMKLQLEQKVNRFKEVKKYVETTANSTVESLTFDKLRDKYIAKIKLDGNVTEISGYITTFKYLSEYFKDRTIDSLSAEDGEAFKLHLASKIVRKKKLSKKTINKHIIYFKQFIKFAVDRDYISKDFTASIKLYNTRQVNEEKPKIDNYTKEEIQTILNEKNYSSKDLIYRDIFKIALYTGMRQGEIRQLTREDIKQEQETGIYYIELNKAKSEAGERQIPIHSDIKDLLLNKIEFPLFGGLDKNKFGKRVRRHLYSVLGGQKGKKNFHTLRGTFIDNIIENNKNSSNKFILHIIQEIVGHSKEDKQAITLDTYKKGFSLFDKNLAVLANT